MLDYKKRILVSAVSSMMLMLCQSSMAESLKDAVARTVNTNPEVRIAAKIRNADDEQVRQAYAGYLPTLDFNAGYGKEKATNFNSGFVSTSLWRTDLGLTGRQMVFDGFATSNEVKRTRAKANSDSYRVWGTAEDQALAAIQAYLDVLRNEELLGAAKKNLENHRATFGMVSRMSQQGVGRDSDTEQTRGREELAKANVRAIENSLQVAKITYQRVTGVRPEHLAAVSNVPASALPRSEEEAIQKALRAHPILKAAHQDIAQARGEYEASKSAFYPRVDVLISALQSKNVGGAAGPDHDRLAELELNWNLFQGGKDVGKMRETAYHVQEAKEIRNRTEYEVVQQMRLSWESYVNASARIPLLAAHAHSEESTYHSYKDQFGLGKRTLLDVLDSQTEIYTAHQDLINERYAKILSEYRMLNSMGKLIQYFNVPLPNEATIPYTDRETLN